MNWYFLVFWQRIALPGLNPPPDFRRYLPYLLIFLGYVAGMWVDVMEIDAAQYAAMGRSMFRSGDFVHLYDHGRDYLDKPPLTFWMTALSFSIFGVSTWAFKLPSVLFSLMAIYGTQRLTSLLYNRKTGFLAALVLASCQAFFLMNNDVKTDMYLIGPMVMGVWLLVRWSRGGRFLDFLGGAAFLGLGMLAKGPLALIAPGLAIGADILLRRDWAMLLRWQWLLVVPIAVVVTTPFLIGQYQQYGWDGVTFFLWTQSFGRVTGQSEWANDATAFFFVHSFAWSFLPWTALFLGGLVRDCARMVRSGFLLPKGAEGISLGGFLLVFTALCFSRFKLPHYIFITYPFAAMVTAAFLVDLSENLRLQQWRKAFLITQEVMWFLAVALMGLLAFWAFPQTSMPLKVGWIVFAVVLSVDMFLSRNDWVRFLWPTALGFALCNLFMNLSIYPAIVSYQSTAQAGKYMSALGGNQEVHAFVVSGRALDFYAPSEALAVPTLEDFGPLLSRQEAYVYTNADGLKMIQEKGVRHEILQDYEHHRPSALSLPFINPQIRPRIVSHRYLLHMPQQDLQF